MATPNQSRTTTPKWRAVRKEAIARAIEQGLTNCPRCKVWLDYEHGKRPNSPEADHIVPHAQGGADHISNVAVICRRCNQQLGGKLGRQRQLAPRVNPVTTVDLQASTIW